MMFWMFGLSGYLYVKNLMISFVSGFISHFLPSFVEPAALCTSWYYYSLQLSYLYFYLQLWRVCRTFSCLNSAGSLMWSTLWPGSTVVPWPWASGFWRRNPTECWCTPDSWRTERATSSRSTSWRDTCSSASTSVAESQMWRKWISIRHSSQFRHCLPFFRKSF